ncbi:glycerol-3-phosphate dehydrogenase [Brevirhabdus pacifica]|uniref:Glycerol-3-phosphate dehydrogenase [NAD(P)+] n=1 Tax=Brevirhabdus pacifica TaxID=1267768 RepID=A0A1U7DIU9_9RHOB|nr:NAD(P)H-dependent glycerol-3-phosphate dehydrogenase [Brevirhabdus pacifica]APX89798.1 glycerol-3-phosphate dehydrogenase [Brevirhabdus pacifica]OWU74474.1 glycerol-3-phosphate dehydrogenase [Loktanella sp. 22II-4b]PJJ82993.1 glycerol-3-phosphate dehydrogenase (NAD(P)+) [Brevirhabdus pacifica]
MSDVDIIGAGAFGTALGVTLARDGRRVCLWSRNPGHRDEMRESRRNDRRLPGVELPPSLNIADDPAALRADTVLLAIPAQTLDGFLTENRKLLAGRRLVACAKGIDLRSGLGPTGIIANAVPDSVPAILSGPSFAVDLANGLPTALTLACADPAAGTALQTLLSTAALRLYLTSDTVGAELGGALKNVMAIACGLTVGAGLGESARAALMTRGYAEMGRFARLRGARPETLAGLSGFGDMVLTCTSEKSRNYAHGLALGRGDASGTGAGTTVEGVHTARAVAGIAKQEGIDMPITTLVNAVVSGKIDVDRAKELLLARPLKEE